ncbi:hypothetical protein N8I77_000950 [Diaporthe amygdali]|uniref:Uncharacterized protein n=1 Tax=Phomopsis amygdali TaxID=1214568 RepID=A0AAD9SR24_PHOAM|nr:hypothetical protein N8I77_000950 [Diaporthe amygdali]
MAPESRKNLTRMSTFAYHTHKLRLMLKLDAPDSKDEEHVSPVEAHGDSKDDHGSIIHSVRDSEIDDMSIYLDSQPEIVKRESATLLELFFDLWFVATLNIFASTHEITEMKDLASYIEFEFLLWTTWFLVVIYDVRFLSDSWTERIVLALHLAAMISFTEVAPFFNALHKMTGVSKALAATLMLSRLVLFAQNGIILWHLRHYKKARLPMIITVSIPLVAAICYAGILAAASASDKYMTHDILFVISILEIVGNLAVSTVRNYKVVSFEGSHLAERLNLLTLIILGEGIIKLAKNVSTIEATLGWHEWTTSMWAVFVSGFVAIYLIFQIYFDWMHPNHMACRRQLLWAMLHAPFHFALLIVMVAVNKFIINWKLLEINSQVTDAIYAVVRSFLPDVPTSVDVASRLNSTVTGYLEAFPATKNQAVILSKVMAMLNDISLLPDELWGQILRNGGTPVNRNGLPGGNITLTEHWLIDREDLLCSVMNSVLSNFGMDGIKRDRMSTMPVASYISKKFNLVFIYAFLSAGVMLMLLTILHGVSKRQGWTVFNIMRSVTIGLMGIGLCLVTLLAKGKTNKLAETPWPLPLMCIIFSVVLIVTYIPHPKPITVERIRGAAGFHGRHT